MLEVSKACLNSPADWKRSAGLTAMAISMALLSLRDTFGARLRRGVSLILSIARARPSSGITPESEA